MQFLKSQVTLSRERVSGMLEDGSTTQNDFDRLRKYSRLKKNKMSFNKDSCKV